MRRRRGGKTARKHDVFKSAFFDFFYKKELLPFLNLPAELYQPP
jgi:hypothetical protein